MSKYSRNLHLANEMLPAEIVLSPDWWFKREGISFDEEFFYNPGRRVEAERRMEEVLYERWGRFGLGRDHNKDLPQVGAVHLAAGFLLSEMIGCKVEYGDSIPPQVITANKESLALDVDGAFSSEPFRRFERLAEALKQRFGYLVGDVNWGGVLNLALDLRGETIFLDMLDKPEEVRMFFNKLSQIIERFVTGIEKETGTSSISVNRTVRHIKRSVWLHSECSHTMISEQDYENLLLGIDIEWSQRHRPFGIHHCGSDPHRFAESYAKIANLDFLDVGWGGDVRIIRKHLPNTFLNIRLSPVEILSQSVSDIEQTITRLVGDSGNPYLTGLCCINMDAGVSDEKITGILETVRRLRKEYMQE